MERNESNHSRVAGAIVLAIALFVFLKDTDAYGHAKAFMDNSLEKRKRGDLSDFRVTVDNQPFGCDIYFKYVGSEELTDVNTVTRVRFANGRQGDFRRNWVCWQPGEMKKIEMPFHCRGPVKEVLAGTASMGSKKVKLHAVFTKKRT